MTHTFTIDESQRQATLLALAILSLQRPGWDYMLGEIAEAHRGREMFESFKQYNSDQVKEVPSGETTAQA